jgi:hypothetical protein
MVGRWAPNNAGVGPKSSASCGSLVTLMMFAMSRYTMFTLVAALGGTTATAGHLPFICTVPASIECALLTAGVRDPAVMTESLIQAELQTVGDVAELSTAEAAELFGELRAASVPLGDRARLRKVAWVHSIAWDREHWGGPGDQLAMLFHSGSLPPLHKNIGDETADAPHRQLQSVGGASIRPLRSSPLPSPASLAWSATPCRRGRRTRLRRHR